MATVNNVTLGNWGRAVITSPFNGQIYIRKIFDFEWRRIETRLKREYITGERDPFSFPGGASGRFSFDRVDAAVESAFFAADASMDTYGLYKNWDITWQVYAPNSGSVRRVNAQNNTDDFNEFLQTGATSAQLTFHNCACTLSEGGTYRSNSVVTQTITFEASSVNYLVSAIGGTNLNAGAIVDSANGGSAGQG